MNEMLSAHRIHKEYYTKAGPLPVLRGINLSVRQGELLAAVGASGAGKSTLLHVLGLLDAPTSGAVYFEGEDIYALKGQAKDRLRNRAFGFVFQFYHLLPEFNALENVLMPEMVRRGVFAWPRHKKAACERAQGLLEKLGLGDRLSHRPQELSGGEQQRVAIARALMNQPAILFCDEPTGNLDERTSKQIMDLLTTLNRNAGLTMVIVTHERELVRSAHRVLQLADGRIVKEETIQELLPRVDRKAKDNHTK